jgi:putative ABC transport system permease protein
MAKSLSRAKEVGIRKVSGAYKYQILFQFIGESVLVAILSLIFAVGLLEILKPAYNALWITQYLKVEFADDIRIYLIFLFFSIIIGMIAGVLPAFYLSSFRPLKVLRDTSGIKMFKKITMRKVLIVTQFSISLFFIITTTLIYYQLKYLTGADYGFEQENLLNIPLHGNEYQKYANTIKDHTGIQGISGSSVVLSTGGTSSTVLRNVKNPEDSLPVSQMSADKSFVDNLNLKIVAGNGFPDELSDVSEQYLLVNETAAHRLGFSNVHEIVGEAFFSKDSDKPLSVIGVLKDFHYSNLMTDIGPFIIRYIPEDFRYVNVRIDPMHKDEIIAFMKSEWEKIDNDHPFEPEFMDQQLAESHAFIGDVGYVIGFISIIAVSIASLGLLGMVIFVTQTKIKEIGIRKAHGANTFDIIFLLSKGFLIMLFIAIIIATPLAKLANTAWLIEFAIRVNFGIKVLAVGIFIMLALGLTTILSQTIRTARINPSETLRYE